MMSKKITFPIVLLSLLFSLTIQAADPTPPTSSSRSRSIDFDEVIVEGMNKNPFDSLMSIGKRDAATSGRIYKRKSDFGPDAKRTVREMGLTQ
jgi:hypothetical protein